MVWIKVTSQFVIVRKATKAEGLNLDDWGSAINGFAILILQDMVARC